MDNKNHTIRFSWIGIVSSIMNNIRLDYVIPEDSVEYNNVSECVLEVIIGLLELLIYEYSESYVNPCKYLTSDTLIAAFYDKYTIYDTPPNLQYEPKMRLFHDRKMKLFYQNTGLRKIESQLVDAIEVYGTYALWRVSHDEFSINVVGLGDFRLLQWEELVTRNGIYDPSVFNSALSASDKHREKLDENDMLRKLESSVHWESDPRNSIKVGALSLDMFYLRQLTPK